MVILHSVYKKVSLYNEKGVKKAHLRAKNGSLQGCLLTKLRETKLTGNNNQERMEKTDRLRVRLISLQRQIRERTD